MGLFEKLNDRLRGIGKFGDAIKHSLDATASPLTLGDDHSTWTAQTITHLKLDDAFQEFSTDTRRLVQEAATALGSLTDEKTIAALPERARTVNEIHAREYAQQARKVLDTAVFTELFRFEAEQQAFQEALQAFQDRSAKHTAALREQLGERLDAADGAIKRLEDTVLRFAQGLEERGFTHVKRLHEAHQELTKLDERRGKEEELLASLRKDQETASARIQELEQSIKEQEGLVRNEEARDALTRIVAIDEELDTHTGPVQQAARDTLAYYRKHRDLTPPGAARQVLESLERDAPRTIANEPERVIDACTAIAEQITQAARPNTRHLATRLTQVAQRIEQSAARVSELLPQQSTLRRGLMRDVAALAAYDKRQFLLAARRDSATIAAKIAFVTQDLAPEKRITHERALKDAALALGATIPGEVPPAKEEPSQNAAPGPATTTRKAEGAQQELAAPTAATDADTEIANAEASLAKAKELLESGKGKKKGKGKR